MLDGLRKDMAVGNPAEGEVARKPISSTNGHFFCTIYQN